MFNKKGERTTVEFTVSLIITVIVLIAFAACGYKFINPNCDPAAVDTFNDFVRDYEKCKTKEGDCEKEISLPSKHNILIKPTGANLENTIITLACNGRESYRFREKIEIKLCFKNGDIRLAEQTDLLTFTSLDKEIILHHKDDMICFVGKTAKEKAEEYKKEIAMGVGGMR